MTPSYSTLKFKYVPCGEPAQFSFFSLFLFQLTVRFHNDINTKSQKVFLSQQYRLCGACIEKHHCYIKPNRDACPRDRVYFMRATP